MAIAGQTSQVFDNQMAVKGSAPCAELKNPIIKVESWHRFIKFLRFYGTKPDLYNIQIISLSFLIYQGSLSKYQLAYGQEG